MTDQMLAVLSVLLASDSDKGEYGQAIAAATALRTGCSSTPWGPRSSAAHSGGICDDSKRRGRIPAELLFEAAGNLIGSFKIFFSERVFESVRRRFAMPCRIGAALLDFVARSKPTAVLFFGLPGVGVLTLAGYLVGGQPLAYTLLGAAIYRIPTTVINWQAQRLLAVRTRGTSPLVIGAARAGAAPSARHADGRRRSM